MKRVLFVELEKFFWFIFPEIVIWMLFIMPLLLFESFPDSGYTTNWTMTGNIGQKCPEIEDKKSKRDMINILFSLSKGNYIGKFHVLGNFKTFATIRVSYMWLITLSKCCKIFSITLQNYIFQSRFHLCVCRVLHI